MSKKKLTRSQALRRFRKAWREIVTQALSFKPQLNPRIKYDCWLCEYMKQHELTHDKFISRLDCDNCPVVWPDTRADKRYMSTLAPCEQSYYGDWSNAKSLTERIRLANLIAKLPRRK